MHGRKIRLRRSLMTCSGGRAAVASRNRSTRSRRG